VTAAEQAIELERRRLDVVGRARDPHRAERLSNALEPVRRALQRGSSVNICDVQRVFVR
jgi:hypothetical protein